MPRLDHEAQLTDLRTQLAGVAMVRRTDRLDACERANVIVIQPSAEGRKAGTPSLARAGQRPRSR